ncbi:MAG: HAD family hydrolase [SAR324 cluster bacterium]|nr:HAD family hydrolase [SAR324 cluster bacterium]
MNQSKFQVIALDLEGTLICSQQGITPRPGLREFLDFCYQNFPRVVVYTLLSKTHAAQVAQFLVQGEYAPPEFWSKFEYISGPGRYKDLDHISSSTAAEVLLVDDTPSNIKPEQRENWVQAKSFYSEGLTSAFGKVETSPDQELARIQEILKQKITL